MGIFSIVWIIMKFFLSFTLLIFLTACTRTVLTETEMIDRIVTLRNTSGEVSRWVIISPDRVLVTRHGVMKCLDTEISPRKYSSKWCALKSWDKKDLTIRSIMLWDLVSDRAIVEINPRKVISSLPLSDPSIGQSVMILTWSGKVSGKILALDPSYIAYDGSLSGSVLSGSFVTDILLEPGESGSPVWTLSGELIGIVSAVDRVNGRSYGVR